MDFGKFKYSVRYGVLAGFAVIVYLIAFYLVEPKLMVGPRVFWSTILLYFIGMFFAARETRKAQELISFREALSVSFLTFMIANLFFYDFIYIVFNFIDTSLPDLQKQVSLELIEETGMAEQFEEAIKQIEKTDNTLTFGKALFSYLQSAIGGFIMSLPIAGMTRNK